jgi:predicted MFS family arabinose efflux permease
MRRSLRRVFERDTLGQAIFPLAVLTLLYFFDEFDTAAMGVLAPDIKKSFGLSDSDFVGLVAVNGVLVALLTVPLGYYADRLRRTRIVVASGIIAGVCSLLTGLAPSFGVLFAARFGNGLGLVANQPVHHSLLADYYTPEARPTVFANHANGLNVGALVAPAVAGGAAALVGWRAAFFVFFIPILITSLVATRLREPVRGATDHGPLDSQPSEVVIPGEVAVLGGNVVSDAEAAAAAGLTFRQSFKELWSIRPLRRVFLVATFMGGGLLPLAAYLPLFLEREYGLGPAPRGAIGSINAAFTIVGVIISAKRLPRWMEAGPGVPMRRIGMVIIGIAVAVVGIALSPWLAGSLLFGFAGYLIVGFFAAPVAVVLTNITPPHLRSLGFSLLAIFLVAGLLGFYATGMGAISDTFGIRWGIATVGPWFVASGLVALTAGKVFDEHHRAEAGTTVP